MQKPQIALLNGYEYLSKGMITNHENEIVHYISDPRKSDPFDIGHVLNLFDEYQVSTHFIICRQGIIYQMIDPSSRAWHAGKSQYNGVFNLNKNSIGVELIGDDTTPFEDVQYTALVRLSTWLHFEFGIDTKNVKGHQIVSDRTVRPDPKPDPGRQFDWIRFGYSLIQEIVHQEQLEDNYEEQH